MDNEPIRIRAREMDQEKHPDLQRVRAVTLREGPRSKVELIYTVIQDRHTNDFHHDSVTIKSFKKLRGEWQQEPTKSISLSSDKADELQITIDFIKANRSGKVPEKSSDYLVVNAPSDEVNLESLRNLLNDLQNGPKADVLMQVLDSVAANPGMLDTLVERANQNPRLFAEAAAALNLATYNNALQQLEDLIERPGVLERDFQVLLKENPWMFGSEYSELLDIRKLTRDEQQDFVLRRTTDNYIELIEIKTTLDGRNLFNHDQSHNSYYPASELSRVLGQVQHYLEQIDTDRSSIALRDREDPLKVRAKIIIGRDGNDNQKLALRRLNGHLHRIEVLTFDQLLRIARRVVSYLESAIRPPSEFWNALSKSISESGKAGLESPLNLFEQVRSQTDE